MILYELLGQSEQHPAYQELQISNGDRQRSFVQSIIDTAITLQRPMLSQRVIKAINFHAITCLHTNAGEYRPCEVQVGDYHPPAQFRVQALMDDFVNDVNRNWERSDPVTLASYVLWRLNQIHPFINGNGRTARMSCYFVLCLALGNQIPGAPILPELLKEARGEYVQALKQVDASAVTGSLQLEPLHALVLRLTQQQIASASAEMP